MTTISRIERKQFLQSIMIALLLDAIVLWLVSLRHVNLLAMNDLGLISVLSPVTLASICLLTISYCLLLYWKPIREPILLLHLVVLIFFLFGTAPIVEKIPRTPIAWKLVGIMDFVTKTKTVDPTIDAFHNWPGFFILSAFATAIFGFKTPLDFAAWAPVFLNLLYLGPLFLIFRAGTPDRRRIWLALWFFYLNNWIGQDYLAPQGFSYFIYLTILGILLLWFKDTPHQPELLYERWFKGPLSHLRTKINPFIVRFHVPDLPSRPWQRVGLIGIVLLLYAIDVPSHQLTPFAILLMVTSLVLFNLVTTRQLPVIMLAMAVAWISFMTMAFLTGHSHNITEPIGSISNNLNANFTNRIRGSTQHLFILNMRVVMTVLIWSIALFGGIRSLRRGRLDLTFGLLALAPFALVGLQAYGGEVLLRVYLFALPFMAFWAAALFFPGQTMGRSWKTFAVIGLLSLFMAFGFFFTRYGNERMDYFTQNEINSVNYLYRIAEPGSQLLAVDDWIPWRYSNYASYRYIIITKIVKTNDLNSLIELMRDKKSPTSYLILTRSEKACMELFIGWPPYVWDRFANSVANSKDFALIYSNDDAKIYVLNQRQRVTGTIP